MSGTRSPARAKRLLLAASALVSGAGLLSWSQEWYGFQYRLDAGAASASASGEVAAPALLTLSLAGLACIAGLALAGPLMRRIIAALQCLLGFTIGVTSIVPILNPVGAVAPVITERTGIEGAASTSALVVPGSMRMSGWPVLALVVAAGFIVIGVLVLRTAATWPGGARRFEVRTERADGPPGRVAQWDALSGGDDPSDGDDGAPRDSSRADGLPGRDDPGDGDGVLRDPSGGGASSEPSEPGDDPAAPRR